MSKIAAFLGLAFASLALTFWGVETLIGRGREIERASQAEALIEAERLASENYRRSVQALDAMRREAERKAADHEAELKGLRDARAQDGNGGDVVFDERWNDWLRGRAAARPAGDRPVER